MEREDVTEGRAGIPLELGLRVLGPDCMPVTGALVDIWHCDALGIYSWYAAADERDSVGPALLEPGTFLRGSQQSGAEGLCRFHTIYPGWYPGRAVHIHGKVHHADRLLTVQLYFPEDITDAVHARSPYASRQRRDTTNEVDVIYREGGSSTLLSLSQDNGGFRAEATLVVG